jgi:hypothetical protein
LQAQTRWFGRSLGDRACLALAGGRWRRQCSPPTARGSAPTSGSRSSSSAEPARPPVRTSQRSPKPSSAPPERLLRASWPTPATRTRQSATPASSTS